MQMSSEEKKKLAHVVLRGLQIVYGIISKKRQIVDNMQKPTTEATTTTIGYKSDYNKFYF